MIGRLPPRRTATALATLCILAPASQATSDPFLINESASLPKGVYIRAPGAVAQRGDIVAVEPPTAARAYLRDLGMPEHTPLLKRVAAAAGEQVCAAGGKLAVPGRAVAVRREDRRGARLPAWSGCGPVPQGTVFLLGDTPGSFDSRYFGPVPLDRLKGVYLAVWSW